MYILTKQHVQCFQFPFRNNTAAEAEFSTPFGGAFLKCVIASYNKALFQLLRNEKHLRKLQKLISMIGL